MEYYTLINERESIRSYDPERKVDQAVLQRILEAGRVAPSAANRQPWRFFLVSSETYRAKITKCYTRDWFQRAPHVLIVVGFKDQAWTRLKDGYNSLETDLSIAMDHMILAAENEGVSTCWIAAFDMAILRELLQLNPNEQVYAITPLGYPEKGFSKKRLKQRKPIEEIVTFL